MGPGTNPGGGPMMQGSGMGAGPGGYMGQQGYGEPNKGYINQGMYGRATGGYSGGPGGYGGRWVRKVHRGRGDTRAEGLEGGGYGEEGMEE